MRAKRIIRFLGILALTGLSFGERQISTVSNPDKPIMGRLSVEAAEKVRIRSDALGKDTYFAIDHYALSPLDENIYLLDAKDFALHVFDASGRQVRLIRIRKGQGPGEFGGNIPLSHRAYPREEGLWVEDYWKIALFDSQGGIIREKQKGSGYYRIQGISPQSLLVIKDEFGPSADPIRAVTNVQRFQLENWEGKSLAQYFSSDKTGGWGNGWVRNVKDYRMTPLILFDCHARGQKIVYAVSDDYTLIVKDLSGKTLQTIRRKFVPQEITGEMRRVIMSSPYFQNLTRMTKQNGEDFEKMMDLNQSWGHLNPMINVQFLDNGLICVFVLKDVQGRFEADLFDQQGRWQATLQFPEAVQKLTEPRLQGNRLAGLGLDEETGESYYLEYVLKNIPSELIK